MPIRKRWRIDDPEGVGLCAHGQHLLNLCGHLLYRCRLLLLWLRVDLHSPVDELHDLSVQRLVLLHQCSVLGLQLLYDGVKRLYLLGLLCRDASHLSAGHRTYTGADWYRYRLLWLLCRGDTHVSAGRLRLLYRVGLLLVVLLVGIHVPYRLSYAIHPRYNPVVVHR